MYIFRDRHGFEWITAEGLRRYFGIRIHETRRYWYPYNLFLKGQRHGY